MCVCWKKEKGETIRRKIFPSLLCLPFATLPPFPFTLPTHHLTRKNLSTISPPYPYLHAPSCSFHEKDRKRHSLRQERPEWTCVWVVVVVVEVDGWRNVDTSPCQCLPHIVCPHTHHLHPSPMKPDRVGKTPPSLHPPYRARTCLSFTAHTHCLPHNPQLLLLP